MPLSAPALARQPDPIPPPAPVISDDVALSRIPSDLMDDEGLQLVLDAGEAPTPKLDGSLRLGWDIWMSDSPPMRDLDDLSLEGTYAGPGTP